MPNPIAPSFEQVASALLEIARHEAELNEITEPFMASPALDYAPNTQAAWHRLQERSALIAWGYKYLIAMAPREAKHRAMMEGELGWKTK